MNFEDMLPAPTDVKIGGQTFTMTTVVLNDYAKAARHMRSELVSPVEAVASLTGDLPDAQVDKVLALAYRDARGGGQVSIDDVEAWFETPDGKAYSFWLRLVTHHPDVTLDDATTLYSVLTIEVSATLEAAMAATDGLPSGNSQTPQAEAGAKESSKDSAGELCSA